MASQQQDGSVGLGHNRRVRGWPSTSTSILADLLYSHTGGYNQSLSPAVVESSSDDSCLLQVVSTRTTTSYVASPVSSSLDAADDQCSSRHRSIYVGAILGAFLFLAFLAIIFLLRRLRQTREEMRHRRTSSLDRPRLILDTASSLNANYDDDAATISSFANRESYVDSPTTPSMSHQRHGSLGGSMSMMTEDPFADPMARREASIASFGSTGTAKEHVELATGPLRVRNAMDV